MVVDVEVIYPYAANRTTPVGQVSINAGIRVAVSQAFFIFLVAVTTSTWLSTIFSHPPIL